MEDTEEVVTEGADTVTEGDHMVFVKVRETYDLHTVQNKMTLIGIHTPKPTIIKKNFPGLLMQCKMYRPYSCDVKVACASVLPLDPLGVGTAEGSVAPEDVFNPILYKATSNLGMSQIEARINYISISQNNLSSIVHGNTADVEVDTVTGATDEFPVYYGLLSNSHGFKHANPQSGLSMTDLRPIVYDLVYNVGDNSSGTGPAEQNNNNIPTSFGYPNADNSQGTYARGCVIGGSKPMPFINTTGYSSGSVATGFTDSPSSHEIQVPWLNCMVGMIIIPPSRLHELFYRMVVEWTIEFSAIRPISEITDWTALASVGTATHLQNYSYASTKAAVTGDSDSIMDSDVDMVSANVDVKKVM